MVRRTDNDRYQKYSVIVIGLVLLILFISIAILAYVPPVSRDALTHHLAIPKLWLKHGGIYEIPSLIFSYYPMNLELLYLIPLYFGNDIFPKYIHFSFALATAWLIYCYLRKRTGHALSLLGVLLFLSTPVIIKLSITAYVDLGLIFFSWASIYYLVEWKRSGFDFKLLIISSLFCGLSMGTKYNGLLVLLLLSFAVPVIYIRSINEKGYNKKSAILYPIIFVFVSVVIFSPWMIRNYKLTNNPIYPLYNSLFNNKNDYDKIISNRTMKPWLQRRLVYQETAFETALVPLRVFFQGEDDNPKYFDGKLNPILFILPFLLFINNRKKDKSAKLELFILASFSVIFLIYASFMVDTRVRYISPIITPLVILSVLGLDNWIKYYEGKKNDKTSFICRFITAFLLIFCLILNVQYIFNLFRSVNPIPFITGQILREEYIIKSLPDYPAIKYINQIDLEQIKVKALFLGNRLYYFDKIVDFNMLTFKTMVDDSKSAKNLEANMQKYGFSHCVIGLQHFRFWVGQNFTDEKIALISNWLKDQCQLLFIENGYAVYQLGR